MKVMVTGGNGFIGRAVREELAGWGIEMLAFDRHQIMDEHERWLGDVRDANAVSEAMGHVDAWIHLAGVLGTQETIQNPLPSAETNVMGGLNVLQAAALHERPGVYIAVGNHWMENTYSITKTAVERFCAMYREERDLPVSVVRAFNAYGPGQSIAAPYGPAQVRKIVPSFVCRALAGDPIEIYGDGSQVMDMIHVRDVARVLVETLQDTVSGCSTGAVVEAGSAQSTTVHEIAGAVLAASGGGTIKFAPMRPGEPEGAVVKASKPPDFRLIPLNEGLAETVAWYRKEWLPTWRS